MNAFVIVDTKITNVENYEKYKALAKPIAESYGGQYRVRGGEMEIMEGELWTPTRVVVVEFPDMDAARAFLTSEEYQPVKAIRNANAECTVIVVDGF